MKEHTIKISKVVDDQEIKAVESLARIIWTEYYPTIISVEQINYMLEKFQSFPAISHQIKDGYLYYLIKNTDNKNIGYVALVPRKEKEELFISKFYFLKMERNKGYGRKTLDFIEQLAATLNLHKLALMVCKNNTTSIKAYETMGFVQKAPIIADIGDGYKMDDYIMEKTITI